MHEIGYFSSLATLTVDPKLPRAKPAFSEWQAAYSGSRLARFQSCGRTNWIQRSETGVLKISTDGCNLRWCPRCRPRLNHKKKLLLKEICNQEKIEDQKFMTLTLKSSNENLGPQLDRLQESFRRLRQCKIWKQKIRYGCAVIELTWSNKLQQWHPHLHVLAIGDFLPQKALSKMWFKCSGGSSIVDIRAVRAVKNPAQYLSKYLCKPLDCSRYSEPEKRVREIVDCSFKRRYFFRFGKFPKIELRKFEAEIWTVVASVDRTLHCAAVGEQWAVDLLNDLRSQNLLSQFLISTQLEDST